MGYLQSASLFVPRPNLLSNLLLSEVGNSDLLPNIECRNGVEVDESKLKPVPAYDDLVGVSDAVQCDYVNK